MREYAFLIPIILLAIGVSTLATPSASGSATVTIGNHVETITIYLQLTNHKLIPTYATVKEIVINGHRIHNYIIYQDNRQVLRIHVPALGTTSVRIVANTTDKIPIKGYVEIKMYFTSDDYNKAFTIPYKVEGITCYESYSGDSSEQ